MRALRAAGRSVNPSSLAAAAFATLGSTRPAPTLFTAPLHAGATAFGPSAAAPWSTLHVLPSAAGLQCRAISSSAVAKQGVEPSAPPKNHLHVLFKTKGSDLAVVATAPDVNVTVLKELGMHKLQLGELPHHVVAKLERAGDATGALQLDGRKKLGEAGVVDYATIILEVQPPKTGTPKTFSVWVAREDKKDGELKPKLSDKTVSTQAELKEFMRSLGGGQLQLFDDGATGSSKMIDQLVDIEDGACYEFVGGLQDALLRHQHHTQVSDKVLERAATLAVLSTSTPYGPLVEFVEWADKDKHTLRTQGNTEREIDGLGISADGQTAVLVEAKHAVQKKHVPIVQEKAKHVLAVAKEHRALAEAGQPHLASLAKVERVVPVLASNHFVASMEAECKASGVGVVKPNGGHLSFTHQPL